jgi:hypothetical protein
MRTYAVCMVGTLVNATSRHLQRRKIARTPGSYKRPPHRPVTGAPPLQAGGRA